MTVINMLSFGDAGVVVADEQSSTRTRKFNVAQKLQLIDGVVYGGAGPADIIKEVYNNVSEKVARLKKDNRNLNFTEICELTEQMVIERRMKLKNTVLLSNANISLNDYLSGVLGSTGQKLDESVKSAANSLMRQIDGEIGMGVLLGGLQAGKFEIYEMNSAGHNTLSSQPYCTIGSGSEESERILSGYVASLPREKRTSIDQQEGLVKILEATNASSNLNQGVGGSPSIVYVSAGKIVVPNEERCKLASELVGGLSAGLLPKNFVYDSVAKVVYNNEDFEKVEEEMRKNSTNWSKLDRILRGYKE